MPPPGRPPVRPLHVFDGRVAKRQIVPDGATEQLHLLRHHGHDARRRCIIREGARVAAGDDDAAGPWRIEPANQLDNAGLAGAGAANQGDLLARPHDKGDIAHDGLLQRIAENEVADDQGPRRPPRQASHAGRGSSGGRASTWTIRSIPERHSGPSASHRPGR